MAKTMNDSFETAEVIAQDITEGTVNNDSFTIVLKQVSFLLNTIKMMLL